MQAHEPHGGVAAAGAARVLQRAHRGDRLLERRRPGRGQIYIVLRTRPGDERQIISGVGSEEHRRIDKILPARTILEQHARRGRAETAGARAQRRCKRIGAPSQYRASTRYRCSGSAGRSVRRPISRQTAGWSCGAFPSCSPTPPSRPDAMDLIEIGPVLRPDPVQVRPDLVECYRIVAVCRPVAGCPRPK